MKEAAADEMKNGPISTMTNITVMILIFTGFGLVCWLDPRSTSIAEKEHEMKEEKRKSFFEIPQPLPLLLSFLEISAPKNF